MRTLIVYYSFTGNNEALARKLQERLDCDVIRIQPVVSLPLFGPERSPPMQTFLKKQERNFLNYAFITLCGGVDGQKEKISDHLRSSLLRKPTAVEELWVNDFL